MMIRAIPVMALLVFVGACHHKTPVAKDMTPKAPISTPVASAPAPRAVERAPQPAPTQVAAEKPRYPDAKTIAKIDELLARIQDAYFDYDRHTLRGDAEQALRTDAQTLAEIIKQYPDFRLSVEGHADERGSDEYNLGLGDARAKRTKEYLVTLGLPADQMDTVSYGKQRPICTEDTEDCWQKNRRAHLTRASR